MPLPRAAALAILTACAPSPRPAPLHNTAAEDGAAHEAAGPQCPPSAPARVRPSSPAVGAFAGTVIDDRCELIPGATIVMTGETTSGARVEITDESGRFAFADLPPDRYVVSVYYLDSTLERGGVRIRAGSVEHVRLAMPPPATASPRITLDPSIP